MGGRRFGNGSWGQDAWHRCPSAETEQWLHRLDREQRSLGW